jgi:outer membrane protein assembly factor BamD (BamD/ComL family)
VTLAVAAMMCALWGCGPKPIKPESIMDTPQNHYKQGLREIDKGNLDGAMEEFNRAKGIDKKYALAFSGIGLVYALKGDFEKALDNADDAIELDGKSAEAYVMKGRILTIQRKGDKWWEDAVEQFDKAIKLAPNADMAYYYKGDTYKMAYKFADAATAFRKVIELKGEYAKQANEAWEVVQKIERAAPGTDVGSKIALISQICRADLTVLFLEEMKLKELMDKRRKKTYDTGFKAPDNPQEFKQPDAPQAVAATDIESHWAKSWIKDVIAIDVPGLQPFPDHTFKPNDLITKADFALVIQNIIIMISNDPAIATKYVGEQSHFPDVRSDHYAYNAIALCAERGIMQAELDGEFGIARNVTGADALLTIRKLQDALKLEF